MGGRLGRRISTDETLAAATLPSSGVLSATQGGTGLDSSDSTGYTYLRGGTWVVPLVGAVGDGATDNLAVFQAWHDALPAAGGMMILPDGVFQISDTLSFTKPVIIQGSGVDVTIIEMSTTANLQNLIDTTKSIVVRDLTLQVETPAITNLSMKAVNLDNPATSGHHVIYDHVKVRGFQFGLFVDGRSAGGTNFDVDMVTVRNCDIQISGEASTISNCLSIHGTNQVFIEHNRLDNNSLGDHVIYVIRNSKVRIVGNYVTNAVGNSACGVKSVTEIVDDTGTLGQWEVSGNVIDITGIAILVNLTGPIVLPNLIVSGNTITTVANAHVSDGGGIQISAAATAVFQNILLQGNRLTDLQKRGIYFSLAAGATIQNLTISNCYVNNWSIVTADTYSAIATTAAGAITTCCISGLYVNGGTNGKEALEMTAAARVNALDVVEANLAGANSDVGSLYIPRMTTDVKNALTAVNGMVVYDTTLNKFQGYENGAWTSLI